MVRCYSVLLATHVALLATAACVHAGIAAGNSSTGGDTWAVIVSSSRYWLNYRHTANALGVYQSVRRWEAGGPCARPCCESAYMADWVDWSSRRARGVRCITTPHLPALRPPSPLRRQGLPDSRILLMLADQPACSPRNIHPGQLFLAPGGPATSGSRVDLNLQADDAEVDYRGREVTVDALLRLLTGRHPAGTPAAKRLRSGPTSRVLLYLTGHGGDEFLKFHDQVRVVGPTGWAGCCACAGVWGCMRCGVCGGEGCGALTAETCPSPPSLTRRRSCWRPTLRALWRRWRRAAGTASCCWWPTRARPPLSTRAYGACPTCWRWPAASWVGGQGWCELRECQAGGGLPCGCAALAWRATQAAGATSPCLPSLPRPLCPAGQSSYAHHIDAAIGQHVVDQFTFHLHQFLTTRLPPAQATHGDPPLAAQPPSLQQLLDFIAAQRLSSEVQVRTDLYPHCLADIPVTHFFGGAGEPPAAAGSSGNSSSSGSAAAQDLLALAQGQGQQTPLAYCYSAPAGQPAAGGDAPDGKLYFDLLAAAGGSGSGGGVRESQQVVPVVVAWAAAAALAHRLLRPSVS